MIKIFDPIEYKSLSDIEKINPPVSAESYWNDPVWYLGERPGYSSAHRAIRWNIEVDPLTITHFKLVAASVFLVENGRALANGPAFSIGMRHAARFMREHSIFDFGDFDAGVFNLYKNLLRKSLTDPAQVREIESEALKVITAEIPNPETDRGEEQVSSNGRRKRKPWKKPPVDRDDDVDLSRSVALVRLAIWKQVYEAGPTLRHFGIPILPIDPFAKDTPGKMARELADTFEEAIPPLPDEVAKPVLAFAHRMLQRPAEDVIALQSGFLRLDPRERSKRPKGLNDSLADYVKSFRFGVRDAGGAWHAPIGPTEKDHSGGSVIRSLIVMIRDACAIVLLSEVGLRLSELCSIEIDDREIDDGLPSCIEIETTISQQSEHFFIKGYLSKKQKKPKLERWLIGARPVGATWEPPSVRAVRVLERLLQPWRRLAGDPSLSRQLFIGFYGALLPRDSDTILPILGSRLRTSMRETIAENVPLERILAPLMRSNQELAPYARDNGSCIRPHQWRKTFLRYLIRIDEGLLPAISQHFKHMTLAITEGSYMPKDPALLDAADSVRAREVTRFLYERRYGKKRSFGRLDATIAETNSQLADLIGDRSYEEARRDLEEFAADHDLQVFAGAHGQCLIGLHPEQARCHRFSTRPGWEARAPDLVTRTPSLCLGCANFSPGSGSADFWRRWYVDNMTAWIESGYEPSFRVAQARAMQAASVLTTLKVPLPLLLARPPKPPHVNPYTGKEIH